MSLTAHARSAQQRGLSRAFIAALALLLSALGGIRVGLDRLIGTSDENPIICAIAPISADQKGAATQLTVSSQARVDLADMADLPTVASSAIYAQTIVSAPSLLQGSAGGPRAP